MRILRLLLLIPALVGVTRLQAQTKVTASPEKWTEHNCNAAFQDGTIHLVNTSGKTAILWLTNANFTSGTIELDIKGKEVRGESFAGVAFHGKDDETYDAIYFRPFVFRDGEKDHAVQYISLPGFDWDVLREKHPGKYEHSVPPNVDPNDWFHAKIVVRYPSVKVFVNGSSEPTFECDQLSGGKHSRLGLWVDSPDGWFKNVSVTSDKKK